MDSDNDDGSPAKKQRKSVVGRKLTRWNPDKDQLVLLAVEAVTSKLGITIPWDAVAKEVDDNLTGEAIKQHLGKVYKFREEDGRKVPQKAAKPTRGKGGKATSTPVKGKKVKVENSDADSGGLKGAGLLWYDPAKAKKEPKESKLKSPFGDSTGSTKKVSKRGTKEETPDDPPKSTGKRTRSNKGGAQINEDDEGTPSKMQKTSRLRPTVPVDYKERVESDDENEQDGDGTKDDEYEYEPGEVTPQWKTLAKKQDGSKHHADRMVPSTPPQFMPPTYPPSSNSNYVHGYPPINISNTVQTGVPPTGYNDGQGFVPRSYPGQFRTFNSSGMGYGMTSSNANGLPTNPFHQYTYASANGGYAPAYGYAVPSGYGSANGYGPAPFHGYPFSGGHAGVEAYAAPSQVNGFGGFVESDPFRDQPPSSSMEHVPKRLHDTPVSQDGGIGNASSEVATAAGAEGGLNGVAPKVEEDVFGSDAFSYNGGTGVITIGNEAAQETNALNFGVSPFDADAGVSIQSTNALGSQQAAANHNAADVFDGGISFDGSMDMLNATPIAVHKSFTAAHSPSDFNINQQALPSTEHGEVSYDFNVNGTTGVTPMLNEFGFPSSSNQSNASSFSSVPASQSVEAATPSNNQSKHNEINGFAGVSADEYDPAKYEQEMPGDDEFNWHLEDLVHGAFGGPGGVFRDCDM